ncbi:MAG: NUDIX hydrolase [Limisphaerales bacterium]
MKPADCFLHCPKCGQRTAQPGAAPFHCAACGFLFYFNPAIAAGAILQAPDDRVLLVRRAKNPHQGKLTVPGGFVDLGEVAEDALRREIREEVSLSVERLEYFCSLPNTYHYRGVTYQVLDFFFTGRVPHLDARGDPGEVTEICWLKPEEINLDEIAFDSVRRALERFIAHPTRCP